MTSSFEIDRTSGENAAGPDRTAFRLGLLGAVPFLVLSLWLTGIAGDHPWRPATIALLTQYSAVVLSFLGGIRWGLAMRQPGPARTLDMAMTILPPLLAWASLSVPLPYTFAVLAAAFAAHGAWDAFAVHAGAAPHWYGRLRGVLTAIAVAALLLAFLATG
jgi:hypothetical protein